jgi:hypothetical protein
VFVFVTGCTGSGRFPATGHAPGSASGTTSAPGAGFGTGHKVLTCADAHSAVVADDVTGLAVGDVVFGGLTGGGGSVPRAEDVGLRLPDDLDWYFAKAPLILRARARKVTVKVTGPGQALAWVPSSVWTTGSPIDLGPWAAGSVTVQNCPGEDTSFLGGILAVAPNPCLGLQVRSRWSSTETVYRRLNGSPCAG